MFEQKGNLFVAYGLAKEQEQSLGDNGKNRCQNNEYKRYKAATL